MDVLEAIQKRRSIGAYKNQALPDGIVEKLLEAARWAPSAGNVQPWEFVVATSQKIKQVLWNAAYGQKDLEEASVVIVVCADEKRAEQSYGARGKNLYCIQDTAAAIQNILLTVFSLGLGSCWIGAFKEDEIRKVIKAPKNMKPVALVPIGVPNEAPAARSRQPVKRDNAQRNLLTLAKTKIAIIKTIKFKGDLATSAWLYQRHKTHVRTGRCQFIQTCATCRMKKITITSRRKRKEMLSRDCDGCSQMKSCNRRYFIVEKGNCVYCPDGTAHLVDGL